MKNNKWKERKTGELNMSNKGCLMKIVEYNTKLDIWVEFQDEYKARVHTNYQMFKRGKVKNPYQPNVYEIGYLGEGKYSRKTHTKIYDEWDKMLQRCYDPYFLNTHPTYRDCFVDSYFHCFQNYAKWREENYYEVFNEKMDLDKDILNKKNKVYGAESCIFLPHRINSLFIKSDAVRGEYPIGVNYHKGNNKLVVQCSVIENGKKTRKHLGYFPLDKPFQAFTCYKQFKENYIKEVADEYKDLIPIELYKAMYKYEVEIND